MHARFVVFLAKSEDCNRSDDHTDTEPKECKASGQAVKAILRLEDIRKCGEESIQEPEVESAIGVECSDDRLGEQHMHRPCKRL